ncbi:hypothetical protein GmHk_15G043123 [Glycine max]|nr:hypothetical protein GmHk_15G043123 [Glycine max]
MDIRCFIERSLSLLYNLLPIQVPIGFHLRKHRQLTPHLPLQLSPSPTTTTSLFLSLSTLSTTSSGVMTTSPTTSVLAACRMRSSILAIFASPPTTAFCNLTAISSSTTMSLSSGSRT